LRIGSSFRRTVEAIITLLGNVAYKFKEEMRDAWAGNGVRV